MSVKWRMQCCGRTQFSQSYENYSKGPLIIYGGGSGKKEGGMKNPGVSRGSHHVIDKQMYFFILNKEGTSAFFSFQSQGFKDFVCDSCQPPTINNEWSLILRVILFSEEMSKQIFLTKKNNGNMFLLLHQQPTNSHHLQCNDGNYNSTVDFF